MKHTMILILASCLVLISQGIRAQNCQAYFEYSAVPAEPYTIQFENLSVGNYAYCIWAFGDGTSSSEEDPVHSYNAQGTYPVCLTIFDSIGACNNTYCREVLVGITAPCKASFEVIPDTLANMEIQYHFINTSTGSLNTWFWNFGDGGTSTEYEPIHQYEEEGIYQVCLYAYDSASPQVCYDNICVTVTSPGYLYFGGQLFADGFPINNPMSTGDTGFAYLYRIHGNELVPIDTNIFYNNMGLYVFNDLLPGKYIVKAGLTPGSENAAGYFPTYYTESVNWANASILDLQDTIYNANIYMKSLPAQSFSGPGYISGTVNLSDEFADKYDELDKPVEMILYSEALEPLAFTFTDGTGFFSFDQLDYGTYFLNADLTGWNGEYLPVTLDPAVYIVESLSITLLLSSTFDIAEPGNNPALNINIYPNPFKDVLNIELVLEKEELIMLEIMDICGRVVYKHSCVLSSGSHYIRIPAADFKPGVYLVSVRTSTSIYPAVNKVVR